MLNHLLSAMGLDEDAKKEIETIAAKGSIAKTQGDQIVTPAPLTEIAEMHLVRLLQIDAFVIDLTL